MVKIYSRNTSFDWTDLEKRTAVGISISPYPLLATIRYIINSIFNGYFSYINRDYPEMKLLKKSGRIRRIRKLKSSQKTQTLKVVFLGDIMISKSGNPPEFSKSLKKTLSRADIIVANIESPVIPSDTIIKRGISLNFKMPTSFLKNIYSYNPEAKWVFSIANNHCCDTSRKNKQDVSGIELTAISIIQAIPNAEVIGAEIGLAKPISSLKIKRGPTLGFVGWSDIMNRDSKHYKKKVVRGSDITRSAAIKIKENHDMLFGFAHGNEEQSYYPLKKTRDRWHHLIGKKKFDVIVGHGPHVLQPGEKIRNKGILFHSIGNFCSPVGKSQTKIGCVPEITIRYRKNKIYSTAYKIHILQQEGEFLSLIKDINTKLQAYPYVIDRLKRIWPTLFNHQ